MLDNVPPSHAESSLFVYPDKFVLKTCGTTQLLNAVPLLLELAASLGCQAVRCKYSRASFLFPEYQVRYQPFGWLLCYCRLQLKHCTACSTCALPAWHMCIAMNDTWLPQGSLELDHPMGCCFMHV